jgi:predicted RNase H-like HicB family nuclease
MNGYCSIAKFSFRRKNEVENRGKIAYTNRSMKEKILKYDVIFEEQSDGGFTVTVPSLPGCISEGDTFEEAKEMIEDAIRLYLEDLEADGEEIPSDNNSVFIGRVEINRDKPAVSL